jgi:excisionase family DNA binding protein
MSGRATVTAALDTLAGEQRERAQRHLDQAVATLTATATRAVRDSIVEVVDRAAPRALSIPQVAEKMSVTTATVRRWIAEEGLPIVRTQAQRTLIPLHRLDEWLEARS